MLDRILTWFAYAWGSFFAALAVLDIAWIIWTAPSLWLGLLAAQAKWFDPFNIIHWLAELIVLSPAIGAILWRDRRRRLRGGP